MKFYLSLMFVFVCMCVGFVLGYNYRDDQGWDISKDNRACLIQWDDGTFSYKSRTHFVGDLGPGESVEITVPDNIKLRLIEGE